MPPQSFRKNMGINNSFFFSLSLQYSPSQLVGHPGFLTKLCGYRNYTVIVLTPLLILPLPLVTPTLVRT